MNQPSTRGGQLVFGRLLQPWHRSRKPLPRADEAFRYTGHVQGREPRTLKPHLQESWSLVWNKALLGLRVIYRPHFRWGGVSGMWYVYQRTACQMSTLVKESCRGKSLRLYTGIFSFVSTVVIFFSFLHLEQLFGERWQKFLTLSKKPQWLFWLYVLWPSLFHPTSLFVDGVYTFKLNWPIE